MDSAEVTALSIVRKSSVVPSLYRVNRLSLRANGNVAKDVKDEEMDSKTPATPSLASYHATIFRKVLNISRFASTRRWPEKC